MVEHHHSYNSHMYMLSTHDHISRISLHAILHARRFTSNGADKNYT